jgi:hypothetical protein
MRADLVDLQLLCDLSDFCPLISIGCIMQVVLDRWRTQCEHGKVMLARVCRDSSSEVPSPSLPALKQSRYSSLCNRVVHAHVLDLQLPCDQGTSLHLLAFRE